MVSDLHLPLGHAQVEAVQDLQFAVRSAHVPAEDRKILLTSRQRSLQISLHFTVPELVERREVRSDQGKTSQHGHKGSWLHTNSSNNLELCKGSGRRRISSTYFEVNGVSVALLPHDLHVLN